MKGKVQRLKDAFFINGIVPFDAAILFQRYQDYAGRLDQVKLKIWTSKLIGDPVI